MSADFYFVHYTCLCNQSGRQIVAKADLPKAKPIIKVPKDCLFTFDNIEDPKLWALANKVPSTNVSGVDALQFQQALVVSLQA
jgi:hypothetical protein